MKKQCSRCKDEFDLTNFRRDRSKHDGRAAQCRQCQRAGHKSAYTTKYVDKYKARNKERRDKSSAFLVEYKKNLKCCFCDESESICLDFHHRDPSEKDFGIGSSRQYSQERILKEIEKCVVVCANCHRKIHAGILHV